MGTFKSVIKTIFEILFFVIIGVFCFIRGAISGSKWN